MTGKIIVSLVEGQILERRTEEGGFIVVAAGPGRYQVERLPDEAATEEPPVAPEPESPWKEIALHDYWERRARAAEALLPKDEAVAARTRELTAQDDEPVTVTVTISRGRKGD